MRYLDSRSNPQFQTYTPRTEEVRRALRNAQPKELRRLDLPFAILRTGVRRDKKGNPIGNPIKRVRVLKSGAIRIDTESGPRVLLPSTGKEWASAPEKLLRRMHAAAKGIRGARVMIRVGPYAYGIAGGSIPLDSVASVVAQLQSAYSQVTGEHDEPFNEFFQGLEIFA